MNVLVTGAAGFIGYHVCKRLIKENIPVIGFDNLNSYYDVNLKKDRLKSLFEKSQFHNSSFDFVEGDLEEKEHLDAIFSEKNPNIVINLAAQAGVRYSIENPTAYIKSNILGFGNILECCKQYSINHLIYASSSSVYGGNQVLPFSESHSVDHPVSMYAATKKSNELMAHSYSHLFGLPVTGLRFFTVYGPWGRPDMALFLFTKAISENQPIEIFNHGNMTRDFTYIDDIVESIFRLISLPASPDPKFDPKKPNSATSWAPYRIFNIGNSSPVPLMKYIDEIERALNKKAIKTFLPMQPGDVPSTSADTSMLEDFVDFKPSTSVRDGIGKFVSWYQDYYSK